MYILLTMLLALAGDSVPHTDLIVVSEGEFVHVMNNADLKAERRSMAEAPYAVRVFSVRENGECDSDDLTTCPRDVIYVAIASFDESPNERLYRLPAEYEWTFLRWLPVANDAPQVGFSLRLKRAASSNTIECYSVDVVVSPTAGHAKARSIPCESTRRAGPQKH